MTYLGPKLLRNRQRKNRSQNYNTTAHKGLVPARIPRTMGKKGETASFRLCSRRHNSIKAALWLIKRIIHRAESENRYVSAILSHKLVAGPFVSKHDNNEAKIPCTRRGTDSVWLSSLVLSYLLFCETGQRMRWISPKVLIHLYCIRVFWRDDFAKCPFDAKIINSTKRWRFRSIIWRLNNYMGFLYCRLFVNNESGKLN